MRKIFTFLSAVLLSATLWAQSPEKMSYQAVIRDAGDNLVTGQAVGMQISILKGSAGGTAVYLETQTPTTNANGLISLEIGTGTTSDNFSAIDWSGGPYFIKTETDPAGGDNQTITGTSQLLSVPYALHAKTAENYINDQVDDADADPTNEIDVTSQTGLLVGDGTNISGLVGSTEGQVLKWDGAEWSLGAGANDVILVEEDRVEINGEINTTPTGSANMLPLAYGYVTAVGTIGNGSGNWSVTRVSEGVYHITIAGENFAASTHIAIVSKIGASGGIGWNSSGGKTDSRFSKFL